TDPLRQAAVDAMRAEFAAIAARRGVTIAVSPVWEARTVACAPGLQRQMAAAIHAEGLRVHHLPSGAGHDGMAMVDLAPIGMLFVRCEGGISHNPAEAITVADAGVGAQVLLGFIEHFTPPRD
ncbi:MAG: M20 family metallo-hydrolase, partial [Aromatoleum sp.]|nr:M20 family metallo-hydrolase [Aromatoleum sp.]